MIDKKIDKAPHYNIGKIEVIEAIIDWKLSFCAGNVVKYIVRADHKGNRLEDLKKARAYINYLIFEAEHFETHIKEENENE